MRIEPIKVLVVDDSPFVRCILASEIDKAPDLEVVGGAKDPFEARELIIEYHPDVIILDLEMPRMDGLTFLRKLVVHYPVPVIMCSSSSESGSQAAIEAIEAGAVDVVCKPHHGEKNAMRRLAEELVDKVRAAAISIPRLPPLPSRPAGPTSFRELGLDPSQFLVLIGASTGGTEAIKGLLSNVPADFPPTAIVQHMPEVFTRSFATRLDSFSPMTVTEAEDHDALVPGRAFVARGGTQLLVQGTGTMLRLAYGSTEPVNRHCPSVDVLFHSANRPIGRQIIGIILTGMGDDGARGLLALRQAGAITFGQDRASSVVYGMPKVAFDLGAVEQQAAPTDIPRLLMKTLQSRHLRRVKVVR